MNTEQLKALAQAATPAPWKEYRREVLEDGGVYGSHILGGIADFEVCVLESHKMASLIVNSPEKFQEAKRFSDSNGAFISAANPAAILDLIETIEQLRAQRDDLVNALSGLLSIFPERPVNDGTRAAGWSASTTAKYDAAVSAIAKSQGVQP